MVLHLDHVAVGRLAGEPEDGAFVDPGVTGEHAIGFAGFQVNRG
jgi:hypothetical protein